MDVDAILTLLAYLGVLVGFAWGFSRAKKRKEAEKAEE